MVLPCFPCYHKATSAGRLHRAVGRYHPMTIGHEAVTEHERLAGATVLVDEDNSLAGLDHQPGLGALGYPALGRASSRKEATASLTHERRREVLVVALRLAGGLAPPVTEAL